MQKHFIVLQGGTLKRIPVIEDDIKLSSVEAHKSLDQLKIETPTFDRYVRGVKYKMISHNWDGFADRYAYNWEVIESQYGDNSSLGHKFNVFETMGSAIKDMLKQGFTVTISGVPVDNYVPA